MANNFWRLLRTYCLESTIVGLKYFYLYPDIISRCFWAVNMITMLALSFMLSFLLYNRFEEMPTRVTIENQFEPLKGIPYPAIVLCSPNQMTVSSMMYFRKNLVDGNLSIDLETALPMMLGYYEIMDDLDQGLLKHLQELLDLNRYTPLQVMGTMPQSCDKFLKRCYMENKLYPNCTGLFKPILTTHGYCCAFNSVYTFDGKRNIIDPQFSNFTVGEVGVSTGLTVVSDYNPDDALPGTLLNAGAIRVMYTDSTEFPADDEMSIVDPNGETHVVLHATYTYCSDEVMSLPMWSRKCYFSDEKHLPFFGKYHNSDCDHMCYMQAVRKSCGCNVFFLPNMRPDAACKVTSIPCIIDVKSSLADLHIFCYFGRLLLSNNCSCHEETTHAVVCWLINQQGCEGDCTGLQPFMYCACCTWGGSLVAPCGCEKMFNWLSAQQCDCPRDCVSRRYRAELVVGNYDAMPYMLRNPYAGLILNSSTSAMHFFFTSPVYVKLKQETVMSIISLVSNLGGVFGLFMGCSAISVAEILFYIYIGIRNYIRYRIEMWRQSLIYR